MEMFLWVLVVAASWKQVPGQQLVSDPPETLYPALGQDLSLVCDCGGLQCEQVAWFRTLLPSGALQMLGHMNQADRVTYGEGMKGVVRVSKRSGSAYLLRILSTSTADRGAYSCVLKVRIKDRIMDEVWRSGVLVLPGESPPTDAPQQQTPRALTPPACPCPTPPPALSRCGSLVLGPLVGLSSALIVALLSTLIYYSQLPRKCQHQFVRKK